MCKLIQGWEFFHNACIQQIITLYTLNILKFFVNYTSLKLKIKERNLSCSSSFLTPIDKDLILGEDGKKVSLSQVNHNPLHSKGEVQALVGEREGFKLSMGLDQHFKKLEMFGVIPTGCYEKENQESSPI